MADDTSTTPTGTATGPPAPPSDKVRALDRLVGDRRVTGGAEGTVRYEWMAGGYFLIQHVELTQVACRSHTLFTAAAGLTANMAERRYRLQQAEEATRTEAPKDPEDEYRYVRGVSDVQNSRGRLRSVSGREDARMLTLTLVVAITLNALMAGLYFAFTTSVMPGLARCDDRTYVTAMQRLDRAIMNPWFLSTFVGSLLVPVVAIVMHLDEGRPRLLWLVVGAICYAVTVVITAAVNIPLNTRLADAGAVTDASAPAVREMYHERWTRANNARTVICLIAVIAFAVALAQPVA
jgi:uncharacterized membrane protein